MTRNCLIYLVLVLFLFSCSENEQAGVVPKGDLPPTTFFINQEIQKDSTSILLTWTNSVDPDGGKVKYEVKLPDTLIPINGNRSFLIPGLDSTHYVSGSIIAKDTAGSTTKVDFVASTQFAIIEDENFENLLITQKIDKDGKNGKIRFKDAKNVVELQLGKSGISNLKGIEAFAGLQKLYCHNNSLTNVNLIKNSQLELLYCYGNKLDSLNVSHNLKLISLFCYFNRLKKLDTSKSRGLKYLDCDGNMLTELDVTNNEKLSLLNFNNNKISKVDISKCTNLEIVGGHSNKLTEIDLSGNLNLKELNCRANTISSLNTTSNTNLTLLDCSGNALSKLNLKNNSRLTKFDCTSNKITEICVRDIENAKSYQGWVKDAGAKYVLCPD